MATNDDTFRPLERPFIAIWDDSYWTNALRYAISFVILVGNGFLLMLIMRYERLRQMQCNLLIACLALCDMMIGVGMCIRASYALYAVSRGLTQFNRHHCVLVNLTTGIGLDVAHIIILGIAYDRFSAIHRPLQYRSQTKWPILTVIFVLSLLTAIGYVITVFYDIDESEGLEVCSMGPAAGPWHTHFTNVFSYNTLIMLIVIYVTNLIQFFHHNRRNSKSTKSTDLSKIQRRITVTVFVLLLIYLVFWLFIPLAFFICTLLPNTRRVQGYVTYTAGFLTGLNSASSIFVYVAKHAEIRHYAMRMLTMNGTKSAFDAKIAWNSSIGPAKPHLRPT